MRVAVRAATSGSARNLLRRPAPHGDDRAFRPRAGQFFSRSPAHEAETVREQHHTYNDFTRSGPQIGFYDFQLILIGAFLRFERKRNCTRTYQAEYDKIAHSSQFIG